VAGSRAVGAQQPHLRPRAMLARAIPYGPPPHVGLPNTPLLAPLPVHRGQQQASVPPAPATWCPWMGSWDQQSLDNSFNTMTMVPPAITDWVADFGFFNHTTSDAGNLTSICPPHVNNHSCIIVGNISSLSVTSVGDTIHSILIMSLSHSILFKIYYLFTDLLLTIGVLWSLTHLAFL
jgi:hypothetical protein